MPDPGAPWLEVTDPSRPTVLTPGGPNAMAVTLGLVGDEWNLQLLRHALLGASRYGDWRARLPISHSVLSARLAWLTSAGLLRRADAPDGAVGHTYELTKRGRDLWPVLVSIWTWERRWVADQAARLPVLHHTSCGSETRPVLTCGGCGDPAPAREVRGRFGPSGTWERAVPAADTRRRSRRGGAREFPETMALLGNRWSAAILGAAFQGVRRFGEFEATVGAPPTVVADRLRTFRSLGVLAPGSDTDGPEPTSYRLTAKGAAFFPVIALAIDWGERWYRSPEGPSFEFSHTRCGRAFAPRLACDVCAEELKGRELEVTRATGG